MNNLASLSLLEGEKEKAISLFDSAICSDPLYVEPYLNIARLFMEMHEFSSAEPYLRNVLNVEKDNVEALNLLGVIKNITERSEEAVEHFQDALRNNADQASVLSNLGIALRATGALKPAIIAFEKAGELSPDTLTTINNLGVLYRETGQLERAEMYFTRAIELFPENPFPYFNISELYIERDDYEKAMNMLKKYIMLVPLDMDNLFKTCGIARMADRLIDVIQEMQSFIVEAEPDDLRVDVVKKWLDTVRK
ncbi:TPR repeat-containing protein YrrB [subsurface metagenome]